MTGRRRREPPRAMLAAALAAALAALTVTAAATGTPSTAPAPPLLARPAAAAPPQPAAEPPREAVLVLDLAEAMRGAPLVRLRAAPPAPPRIGPAALAALLGAGSLLFAAALGRALKRGLSAPGAPR